MAKLQYELPWKVAQWWWEDGGSRWEVTSDRGDPRDEFSVMEDPTEADCKFIVRACNTHEALVTALKAVRNFGSRGDTEDGFSVSELVRKALNEVEKYSD